MINLHELFVVMKDKQEIYTFSLEEDKKYFKAVIHNGWILISLCIIENIGNKYVEVKDIEIIYTNGKTDPILKEVTLSRRKSYDHIKFYKIPKEIFPEYYL